MVPPRASQLRARGESRIDVAINSFCSRHLCAYKVVFDFSLLSRLKLTDSKGILFVWIPGTPRELSPAASGLNVLCCCSQSDGRARRKIKCRLSNQFPWHSLGVLAQYIYWWVHVSNCDFSVPACPVVQCRQWLQMLDILILWLSALACAFDCAAGRGWTS